MHPQVKTDEHRAGEARRPVRRTIPCPQTIAGRGDSAESSFGLVRLCVNPRSSVVSSFVTVSPAHPRPSRPHKLLVCQHVPHEILGTLNPLLRAAGFRIRYVNFGRHPDAQPALDGYGGLVILGGPMNVDQVDRFPHLRTELRLIESALTAGLPVLGICLGAQLIARALGARVRPNREKEIGWFDVSLTAEGRRDRLLAPFAPTERVFQWHGDTFDIPRGAVRLVTAPGCTNQAFRYADNAYGLQFHLEVDERLIERWLRVEAMRREIEPLGGEVHAHRIRGETPLHIERLKELSDAVFGEFVRLFGPRRRRLVHPSR
jgi:GMP synthase (glutamine-hydrolysing)